LIGSISGRNYNLLQRKKTLQQLHSKSDRTDRVKLNSFDKELAVAQAMMMTSVFAEIEICEAFFLENQRMISRRGEIRRQLLKNCFMSWEMTGAFDGMNFWAQSRVAKTREPMNWCET